MLPRLMVVLFVLLVCGSVRADELPDAPRPHFENAKKPKPAMTTHYDRRVFWTGISLLAAAKTADAITTRSLLNRGGIETDPIYGRNPSPAKQAAINLGFFAAQSAVFYVTEHNRHAWVRWTGRTWMSALVVNHAMLAHCNASLNVRSNDVCSALHF